MVGAAGTMSARFRPVMGRAWGRRGFALIVTLSLMILLLIVAVGLLTLFSVALRTSSQSQDHQTARANALEHWFALDPKSPNDTSGLFGMIEESGNLFFKVTFESSFRDSTLSLQKSENLLDWDGITIDPDWISDATNMRTIKVPVSESIPKKLHRIKVSF